MTDEKRLENLLYGIYATNWGFFIHVNQT